MKKIISLVILLMISLISLNAQGTYSIKATINGLDTDKAKKAYLCQLVGHIMQDVDSSEIVDNKFAFKGKFGATVNSAIIKIDGVMGGIPLFIEDGDITINGNASELYMSKINGGKYSKAISEFTNKDVVMYDKAMSMLDKHHKARSNINPSYLYRNFQAA